MGELISDKKEIKEIIENKIKGKKLIFTDWYQMGILKKEHKARVRNFNGQSPIKITLLI